MTRPDGTTETGRDDSAPTKAAMTGMPRTKTVLALCLGLVLLWALREPGPVTRPAWWAAAVWLIPAFLVVEAARRLRLAPPSPAVVGERALWPGLVLAGCLFLYLLFSAVLHDRFYFIEWAPAAGWRSVLFGSPLAKCLLLTAVFTPLLLRGGKRAWTVALLVLFVSQLECALEFISKTDALALYNDDHPSFMFRLWVAARSLPHVVYYNPLWNGGKAATYMVSSGTTGVAALLWPLWRFSNIRLVYTPALAVLFIVVSPLVALWSVRLLRGSWTAALTGAVLVLAVSRYFFTWLLHFGTLGACFSLSWVTLFSACLYRLLWDERPRLRMAFLLVLSGLFFFAWPPSMLMALPLLLGAVCSVRRWPKRSVALLAGTAAAMLLVCAPYLAVILGRVDLQGFYAEGAEPVRWAEELTQGWARFREHLWQGHPVILFLGVAGAAVLSGRGKRRFFVPAVAGLLLMAGWGKLWKPQFELSRAGMPLFFVAALPAALWAGRILESRSPRLAVVRAGLAAILLMAGINASRFYDNKQVEKYRVISAAMVELGAWLRTHTPEHGRILFAGCAVHGYGGGHVAYLPVMAQREMMACDYYHFSPARVEYNYPPRAFRTSCAREQRFFDLYNVTHVVTYHPPWITEFRNHPELFEEVWAFGGQTPKKVFRVRRESNQFLRGRGTVRATINRLDVTVADVRQPAVLKYHWADGLRADPPVDLAPYDAGDGIEFIEVHPNGTRSFRIDYRAWL